MENKWTYKFPIPKKVGELLKEALIKNNILWIKKKQQIGAVHAIRLQTGIDDVSPWGLHGWT